MKWVRRSRTSLQGDEKGEGESKNRHPSLFMTWARVGHLRKNGSRVSYIMCSYVRTKFLKHHLILFSKIRNLNYFCSSFTNYLLHLMLCNRFHFRSELQMNSLSISN